MIFWHFAGKYFSKLTKSRASKFAKTTFLDLLYTSKLISRKILVTEKIVKFPHSGLFMAFFGTWRKSTHHKWISRWQTILKISTIIDWFHVKSNWQIFTNFYTVHFAPLAFLWPFLALDAKVHITNEFQEGSLKFDDIKHKLDLHSKLQFWLSFS